ncbi:hypothetical protein EW026_g6897 [Hermanssonia centrifuga]|uniref:Uncharacterized protein n=1 Tax=Hermanssonia centrifuga TaxID=98765 RepID=A0A4S4KDY7_9APHY|nr:hypothetical protein EW026_g6897 [Hermanssonia centrifuga]
MTLNNNNISSEKNLAPRQPGDDRGSTSLGSSRPRTGKENFRSRIPVRILPTGKGKAKADPKGPAPPNVKPQPIVSLDSYPESPELLEKDRWFLLDCRLLPPPPVPPTIEQNSAW